MADQVQEIDSEVEQLLSGTTPAALWLKKIKAVKASEEKWRKQANEAIKVYEAESASTFNLFHSNVETVAPAIYNSTPIPDVRRRYGDKDPVAKLAGELMERGLSYSVDQYPFNQVMRRSVRDGIVPGRGTARVMYVPQFTEDQTVGYEDVICRPVAWNKWGFGDADCWEDVPFVYFEHELDKADVLQLLMEHYKKDLEKVKSRLDDLGFGLEKTDDDKERNKRSILKTLTAYEIWDAEKRKVIWIADKEEDEPLCVRPDPLELPSFFPVPEPIQSLRRVSSMTPICPYTVHKHLFDQLDRITMRIDKLTNQLKVRGLVAKQMSPDMGRLKDADDGEYIEVNDETGQFAYGNKGLEAGVSHFPMEPTVLALRELYTQQEQVKQRIYEATGLSDIVRGASNPNETATAQNIKQQWGSLRVQELQAEVARFACDIFRMKASIMARMFKPQTLMSISGLPQNEEERQMIGQAIQLLQNEAHRGFRIDIETDSTIRADLSRNQEQMNLFLQGTAQYAQAMAGALPVLGQAAVPVVIEIYTAFARKFKLGKQAEDALESLSQIGQQAAQQPQQEEGPSPEEEAAAEEAKAEIAAKEQAMQQDAEAHQRSIQQSSELHDLAVADKVVSIEAKQQKMEQQEAAANANLRS